MNRRQLLTAILQKQSFLCIGLDTDLERIPKHLLSFEDPVFEFNRQIIEATSDLCVAYKPNTAFYECRGAAGWQSLHKTLNAVPEGILTIADAKRGDIGITSALYARAFFENMDFDAITVAPYMGRDSVQPFLDYSGKWVILLALTSNAGSEDFQLQLLDIEIPVYEFVMKVARYWGTPEQLMFVVGATHPEELGRIRRFLPDHFILVPGVGAQGGDLRAICQNGLNADVGLLVNASRSIIYAGDGEDFAERARAAALDLQQQMAQILQAHPLNRQ